MKQLVKEFNLLTILGETRHVAEFVLRGTSLCFKNDEETRCRYEQILRFLDEVEEPNTDEIEYIQRTLNIKCENLQGLREETKSLCRLRITAKERDLERKLYD